MNKTAFDLLRELLSGITPVVEKTFNLHLGQLEFFESTAEIDSSSLRQAIQEYPTVKTSNREKRAYLGSLGFNKEQSMIFLPHCERTMGSRNALFGIFQSIILREGKGVTRFILPDPGYPTYTQIAKYVRGQTSFYNSDKNNLLDSIIDLIVKHNEEKLCLVICSPLMPQSDVVDASDIQKIMCLVKRHNITLVVDECYRDFQNNLADRFPLSTFSTEEYSGHYLYALHSLSKRSGLPGLRSGFAFGTQKAIDELHLYNQLSGSLTNSFFRQISVNAWEENSPYCIEYVKKNWVLVKKYFGQMAVVLPEEGMFLWLPVSEDKHFTQCLWQNHGIKVMPGSYLSASHSASHSAHSRVRIALNQKPEQMDKCLASIFQLHKQFNG